VYVPQSAQPPETIPALPPSAAVQARPAYAGFWLRAAAFLIDILILGFAFVFISASDPAAFILNLDLNAPPLKVIPRFTPLGIVLVYLMVWLYFALFEASVWQATPGKRILRLYVTDLSGRRLTLARAALRNIARFLSGFLVVGYFLAGFTQKKQALHDILASCLVLRRP
jgi:uncharacterized RDD family membrane protein YckC